MKTSQHFTTNSISRRLNTKRALSNLSLLENKSMNKNHKNVATYFIQICTSVLQTAGIGTNRTVKYVIKVVIRYFVIVFIAFTINFTIPRLSPGDPIAVALANMESAAMGVKDYEAIVAAYRVQFGLDGSWLTQYTSYISQVFRGNLGVSIASFPQSVNSIIANALPWTIGLLTVTVAIGWVLGNLLGAVAGWHRKSKVVTVLTSISLAFYVVPFYVLAILLIFVFVYLLNVFPIGAYELLRATPTFSLDFVITVFRNLALPALAILLGQTAAWIISMRAALTSVMSEDYVKFAEIRGFRRNTVLMKYAFRNALLPQITGLAISLGGTVSGGLLTETIFGVPGLGTLLYNSITRLDYNVVQGITLVITLVVCTATLLLDLVYPLIDPRIKYERA